MGSRLSADDKVLLRKAIKEAARLTKIEPNDTDRDILGKMFTHFRQTLGYKALPEHSPKRMKQLLYSNAGAYEYVKQLLTAAMEKITRENVNYSLKGAILIANSLTSEAESINQKSSIVIDTIDRIQRRLEDGREG